MKYTFDGVNIAVGKRSDTVLAVRSLVGRGGAVFTVNSLMLEEAYRNGDFCRTLADADICTVDGVGVRVALALRGVSTDILTGVELGELIVSEGNPSLAIIGGREGIAERAFLYLKAKNPRLRKSLILSGYGKSEAEYLSEISRYRPRLCFVCLGSPKQECFIMRAREVSPKTLFLALGGSLDIYSGEKRRAPKLMRSLGLEWLSRMISEPHRIKALPRLIGFCLRSLTLAKNPQKSAAPKAEIK